MERGGFGIGDGQDLVGPRVSLGDQARNAMGEDRGLAGSGTGDDQHRPVNVLDGLPLALVRNELRFILTHGPRRLPSANGHYDTVVFGLLIFDFHRLRKSAASAKLDDATAIALRGSASGKRFKL